MTIRLQRSSLVLAILGAALLFVFVGRAEAATFAVNTPADTPLSGAMCTGSEPCSLRAAVQAADAAGGANTITLPAGTYTLTVPSGGANNPANGDLDVNANASVTIEGAGAATTVIDANGIDRAFAVQSGSALDISGVTIEGGDPAATSSGNQNGGAIWAGGDLDAGPDLVLTGNETIGSGGGVFVGNAATASFTDATIEKNRVVAGGRGGGIAAETTGNLTLASSALSENETAGGAESYGGNLAVGGAAEMRSTDTDYRGGKAVYGGGVFVAYTATSVAEFSGGSISGNEALAGRGGGIFSESPVTLTKVTFSGDTAGERGGAVAVGSPVLLRVVGSTFLDNSAEYSGAIDIGSMSPENVIVNSTFSRNSATQGGSVIGAYYFLGKFDLVNSTIAGNLGTVPAVTGFGIIEPYEFGVANSIIAQNAGGDCETGLRNDGGHNILGPSCEPETPVAGDQVGVDPLVSPPADNGGGIETMALAATSPAIDAGDAVLCPATDQRGVSRAGACDIGAFEYIVPTPEPPAPEEPKQSSDPTSNPDPTPTAEPAKGDPKPSANPAAPAPAAAPSARYKFGIKKIVHVREGGTAKLRIRYNGPGVIQLSGKRVESVSRRTQAGVAYLPIVPNEALAAILSERGRVHVTVMVQFTPDAGVGRIKEKQVGVWLYA